VRLRLAVLAGLLALVCLPAHAVDIYARYNGNCMQGGSPVTVNGIQSSQKVMQSFPGAGCSVTVFLHGTLTLASIFSDAGGLFPLANPFSATSTGIAAWYSADGRYDVQYGGTSITSPFTISDIGLCFSCVGGTGTVTSSGSPVAGNIPKFTSPTNIAPAAATDLIALWSGTCNASTFLRGDGACATAGGGTPGGSNTQLQFNNSSAFGGITNVAGGSLLASGGVSTTPSFQVKAIYDTRDWMTCDGSTDASSGMNSLLSAIGTAEASIRFIGSSNASAACRIGNTFFPANVSLDFSGGGALQLISSSTVIGGGSYVNGTSVECGTGTTCSLPALSVTAGNTIVVMEAPYPGFTFKTTKVADSCGNFYIHVFQSLANQPRNQGAWVASNVSAGGGTCIITATTNGSVTTHMMLAAQVTGMGPVTALDTSASANSTGTTMSSGAATTLTGAFLLGFGGQPFTSETCTAGAGYTQPASVAGQSTNGHICAEYKNVSSGGSTTATQTITSDPSPGTWVYSLISLKPGNATGTIWGGIINPDRHQIFLNADSATGHGVIDFTGSPITFDIYPEWWGASSNATGATNTPAIQAAIWAAYGGGQTQARTNASGLAVYNRPLRITSSYPINGELKMYDVIGFQMLGVNRLFSGFTQNTANLRIIDGQAIAYGEFSDLNFTNAASSTNAQVDLDFNGTSTPNDLRPQFIDFHRDNFVGNNQTDVGVLIAKSGGTAQGSNIQCYDCASVGFTGAAWQIGGNNTGRNAGRFYALNALALGYTGDIQGCPLYGIAVYGGGYISVGGDTGTGMTTMENGFSTQTGFDMYCEATQGPCIMDHVRSESRRLIAGSNIHVKDSRTLNQSAFPTPGNTFPVFPTVGSIIQGSAVGGDGHYYKVTGQTSAFGGVGTPAAPVLASSGSTTTVANTNETVAGSLTIKAFTALETVTQAVTGASGTLLNLPTSTGTITGSVATGTIGSGDTMTQATSGVTCTSSNTPTGTQSLLCTNFSGTADNSHTWTDGTTSGTYAPTAAPTFSVSSPPMLITAHTGAPDNSHDWVGGTSAAHYTPTAVPAGAGYTVNAFAGFRASILSGTNVGCYGVVVSNTATVITVSSWLTNYQFVPCTAPDSTSSFVVEPNWGTQTTSGGMTWADMAENGIENNLGSGLGLAVIEDTDVPGDTISIAGPYVSLKNTSVTRNDWLVLPSGNAFNSHSVNDLDLDVYNSITITQAGHTRYQNWAIPRLTTGGTPTTYNGTLSHYVGTKPMIWSCGDETTGIACNDTWIGGRTNSNAAHDATLTILEYGGMLGRATPFGTNQAGTDTDMTGGPSTGSANGGAINFWTSNPGGSGTTVNSGLKRWLVSTAGHFFTGLDNTYDIGATGANRPRNIYAATQFISQVATGTAPIVVSSTTPVANLTAVPTTYNHSGTQATGAHVVQDRCTLGTSCSVTLTGSAVYTSSSTYDCVAIDRTGANAIQFAPSSGSAFALTGTGTDAISYVCVGN